MKNQPGVRGAQRLLLIQLSLTLLIAGIAGIISDTTAACSAVLGGLVCVVPNAYFVHTLFKYNGAKSARKIVNGFYKGEAMKLTLSVTLFALVFKFAKINPLMFFVAYIAAQMIFWFAPLIVVNKRK